LRNLIRKVAAIGSVAAGVGAAIALALVPGTALAHEWVWSDSKPAAGQTLAQLAAAQSPACQAAVKALADWREADRAEDAAEKLVRLQPGFDPASDVAEDLQERAALKALWDTIRTACAPQVATAGAPPAAQSDACVAAKQKFKDALAAQMALEKSEKASGFEGSTNDAAADKQEHAQLKALWDAKHAACGNQVKAATKSGSASFAGWQNGFHRK
jgi:hypothetical protein